MARQRPRVTYRGEVAGRFGTHGIRHRLLAVTAGALAVTLGIGLAAPASAVPRPTRDIRQVQRQVEDLQMQAETATEQANAAQITLDGITAQLAGVRDRERKQKADLARQMDTITAMARTAYMNGSFDPGLQVLLADDPVQFLSQAAVLGQLQSSQVAALRRVQTARLRLSQTDAEIADKEKQAKAASDSKASALAQVDKQLAAAQAVLASLQAAERRRLAALEAQQRAQQRIAAAQAAARAAKPANYPGVSPRAQAALRYAISMVGHRYVAATAGPSTFDCSGLTMAAWQHAGVSLAHLSYTQFHQTVRVPVSQIRPGDLVFYFGRGAHHVAMYIGNGKMVSASNPSAGVQIIDFLGPWYGARFSGVGRVIT